MVTSTAMVTSRLCERLWRLCERSQDLLPHLLHLCGHGILVLLLTLHQVLQLVPHLLLVLGVLVEALVDLVGVVAGVVSGEVSRPGPLEQLVDGVRWPVPLGVRLQSPMLRSAHGTDGRVAQG